MKFKRMAPVTLTAGLLGVGLAGSAACAASSSDWNSVAISPPGYETAAGALSHTEQCRVLERRFDAALTDHQKAPKLDQAQALRTAGANSCNAGQMSDGIDKLKQALNDIGVSAKL